MKHRNNQNKFILAEYKRLEVQRLYKKINQINQRKNNNVNSLAKNHHRQSQGLLRIPKTQDQIRKYEISQENIRLVGRLSAVKSTVMPHIVTPKKSRPIEFQRVLKNRAINEQNQRLAKVISQISLTGRKQH